MEAFLRDPELRPTMETVVRHKKVPEADVEDVVSDALADIARRKKLPTTDAKGRRQWALGAVRHKAADYHKKRKDQPDEVPLDDLREQAAEADDTSIRRADDGEHLDKIAETVPEKQRSTMECLVRHLMGENLADMAREMNVQYDTLYKRVTTLHRRVRETGMAIAKLAVVVLIIAGGWHVFKPHPEPQTATPPSAPAIHSPEALRKARDLRKQAFQACSQDAWTACERLLDEAADYDSDGESDPKVKAARTDLKEAPAHGGDTSWSPKHPRLYEEETR
jgi:DNA-directed RNA polymerase specialized sigma24 family protein